MHELQILALLLVRGIGPKTVIRALEIRPPDDASPDELFSVLQELKPQYPRLALPTPGALEMSYCKAEAVLAKCGMLGIAVVGWDNSRYPRRLKSINDPPAILYVKGDVSALHHPLAIAVVGTREPSDYGRRVAERFGERLALNHVAVVSGLALGCDTAAHEGCLREHGVTVAVMAHGLDDVYPKLNSSLAEQIQLSGGALISEYPPGVKAQNSYFVQRDRLQSGLSDAVVVVETDIRGGTMHTARFCEQQGRILAAVSHSAKQRHEKSRGNELLIEKGSAMPLRDIADIALLLDRLRCRAQVPDSPGKIDSFQDLESAGQLPLF